MELQSGFPGAKERCMTLAGAAHTPPPKRSREDSLVANWLRSCGARPVDGPLRTIFGRSATQSRLRSVRALVAPDGR